MVQTKPSGVQLSGVWTALITPFRDGSLDQRSFLKLLKQQMDAGVDGVVVNGTTGESPTLSIQEVKKLVEWTTTELAGAAPIIVGAGSNSTEHAIGLCQALANAKPAAFLQVVPYYNRPPQRGLLAHFTHIAEATDIPLIVYNVPSRTVARLEADTVAQLAEHHNIVGIKEASGDLGFLKQLQALVPKDFALLSGDDATCVDFISQGGHGVISVCSHVIGQELKQAIRVKDKEFAQKYSELLKYLYIEANPIPVKMAMYLMGIIDSPEMRLPLIELDQKFHKDLEKCLKNIKKI